VQPVSSGKLPTVHRNHKHSLTYFPQHRPPRPTALKAIKV